jgi:aldose 1-epimerase
MPTPLRPFATFLPALALATAFLPGSLSSAEPSIGEETRGAFGWKAEKDAASGWTIVSLRFDDAKDATRSQCVRICPEAGANLFSYVFGGTELLQVPKEIKALRGGGSGTPILYPTPNRVRNGRFAFEGREFKFSDTGKTTIHGLVLKLPWQSDPPVFAEGAEPGVSVTTFLDFDAGSAHFDRFPVKHRLEVTYALTARGVRVRFTVANRDTQKLPFGFALHPYFRISGAREKTVLRVPALKKMEATPDLLPTGRLLDLDGAPFDLREGRALSDLALDDVYWGLTPDRVPGYVASDTGLRVDLPASGHFTHMVVYTPKGQPFFCMENQTCSTDAHNLHAQGLPAESHLLVVEPGASMSGWVEIRPAWSR